MRKFFFSLIIGVAIVLLFLLFVAHKQTPVPQVPTKAPQTKVTIIEGWTNNDIASDLDNNPKRTDAPHLASPSDFLAAEKLISASDYPFLSSKPTTADLEGFLFPDTYFLPEPGTSTNESLLLIKKALDNFGTKFTASMQQAAQARGMSVYQIVTLASIIERESGVNEDRGTIAGLFYNRLNAGMPLQSDATVNFITGNKSPSVSIADTKIDSPYNTYLYKGLPPGPICNPSLSSLMAAVYPTSTDYLYFLTDPQTGKAIFAQTFDQQLTNQQKYLTK